MNRHHLFKPFLTALLTIAALAAGQSARAASTFTVTSSTSAGNTTFTITRNTNATAETVYYRTVSLSALEGQHFTAVSGSLTFTAGQTSKTVTVTEAVPSDAVYKVYSNTSRQYRFELLDVDGTVIAQRDRTVSGGTQFTDTYLNKSITGLTYFDHYDGSFLSGTTHYLDVAHSGSAGTWVKVDHGGYSQAVHTVSTGALYNSNSTLRTYLNSSGTKMYATVYFTQKEDQDGYQYIQILADNSTTCDGNDPNGAVNTPSTSLYKACFILSYNPSGSVETNPHTQFFPHRWDYADRNAQYSGNGWNWQEFDYDNAHLYEQEFKSTTPSLRAENSGSLVLAPTVNNINVRFDAAGSDGDDWYFKDLKVRLALVDATAPTVLNNYKVSGGRHQKGNIIYVSVPFSELVTVEGTPTLTTTWGTLSYCAGSGSNVLTFCGQIASDATGTFSVSALSGTVKDLAGNNFSGTVSKNFSITLDATYVWSLSDLNQLAANTYEIATKTDLYRLANIVNVSHNECSGITFRQTQDIVCDAGYTPIGYQGDNDHSYFRGTYDGQGHTVSGITVTRTGNTSADKYIGLFGCIAYGTVQNVVLANSTFTGYERVGGIAGYNSWGTVRNCRVESSVTIRAGYGEGSLFGGVVGYLVGTEALISGCVSAATINGNSQVGYRCGGIVGSVDNGTLKDCLYIGTSITGTSYVGSIAGEKTGSISNNYYTAISLGGVGAYTGGADQEGARRARTITLGEGIALSGSETTYDVSGITAYGSTAIGYGGKIYSGASQTLTLSYTGTVPAGYSVVYKVTRTTNGSDITASVLSGTTLTMPAYDVTVSALLSTTLDVAAGTWQLFSSPVNNPTVTSTGLTSGTYDLYQYDEATATWQNHKASSFPLENGRGYLYRRANATTLTFSGQLNSEATYSVALTALGPGDLRGFNLVGNPYPYKVLLDRAFYSLNADGTWQEHPDGDSLAIGQAALVHCSSAETLTFYAATRSTNAGAKGAMPPLPKGLFLNEIEDEDEIEIENTTLNNHRFAYFDGDRVVISGTGLLQAYDIMGRQLFAKELSTLNSQISILNFPGSGVYLLRLNGQTQKIVIR